ncbi:RagB/SusD family nutrient uptake outer membrane protein [Zobellia sp. 1_MG-2023]|uniref:RagB/SusD family nutrient uptake outer membrane protein n=1 Tax=Zobellia sp. 1_MG-2023 TaxID=3062626 RepID=UPI0026E3D1C0|nr:RagB/SusD family nutrient uptake outer membrane protein [Zobellia sp. 1_MG-2023]MDO6819480.1 RagB/SusD family nutrient uptake outer membrane protein [Zobellia sp. 1_MG-2023]
MKTKIANKFLMLLVGFLALSSCEEFLEEDLRDEITPDAFFTNDKEAELAVNGVYRLLHDNNVYRQRGLDNYYTSGSDIQAANRDVNGSIHNYLIQEGTADGNGTWIQLYRVVNNTTEFISNIEGNESLSEDAKNSRLGELLFLRALAYFHLTNLWGDVPFYTEQLPVLERSVLGRTPKEEIRSAMKEDLATAFDLLPSTYSGNDLGRASKWAAATLKAKYHLFDQEWALAKAECDVVIDGGAHRLLDNYSDVFDQSDPSNQYNDEYIFVVDFEADYDGNLSTTRTDDYNPRIRDEPAGRNNDTIVNGVSGKKVDIFQGLLRAQGEDMTGYGWSVPLPEFAMRENWQEGDLRYDATIVTEYLGWKLSFPYFRKNWNLDQENSLRGNHPENYIVFRLADVYLMAAEAENELNGPGAAYFYVNKVRERAFEPDQPWSGMSKEEFREALYDERKFELSAEGHRRMDLIRWGILLETVQSVQHRPWNNPGANIQPYHVLLPVPQNQLELNPNLLESDPTNNGYR